MSPLASLRRLPRYRDPISRNVARLLLRSLQEQHRAPSHTVVECEARFGILLAQSSSHRHEFPVSTVTAAILDPLHKYLYTFQPGVSWQVYQGVQQGLAETGIAAAAAASFAVRPNSVKGSDVLLTFGDNTRVSCDYGTVTQMKRDVMMTSMSTATVPGGAADHLGYSIVPRAKMAKATVAQLDMCCPEWCADMRFAVATETALPLTPQSVLHDYPTTVRWRHRLLFHMTPFFTVYMARNVSQSSLWWYPVQRTLSTTQHSNAAAGETIVIPCPNLHHYRDATVTPVQSAGHERNGGQEGYEVEVEVHVEALLRAWKKVYGGAAASAYLDTAALCSTTVAGTGMDVWYGAVDSANSGAHDESTAVAEARACALAEREDPLLLRIAEDFVALVQFLAQIRVVDAAPPRHTGV